MRRRSGVIVVSEVRGTVPAAKVRLRSAALPESVARHHRFSGLVQQSLCKGASYEKFDVHERVNHLVRKAFDALVPFS